MLWQKISQSAVHPQGGTPVHPWGIWEKTFKLRPEGWATGTWVGQEQKPREMNEDVEWTPNIHEATAPTPIQITKDPWILRV